MPNASALLNNNPREVVDELTSNTARTVEHHVDTRLGDKFAYVSQASRLACLSYILVNIEWKKEKKERIGGGDKLDGPNICLVHVLSVS